MKPGAPVRRICVVRMGGMGDILLATPSVRALSRHFDTTEIDFVVGKGMGAALTGIPYLRRVIEWDKKGDDTRPDKWLAFLMDLRRQRYDLFVNFHPSVKTFLMAAFSGAPRRITFRKDQRIQNDGHIRHAVEDFAKELAPLGIGLPSTSERYLDWCMPDAARVRANELLTEAGVGASDKLVLINPAASHLVNRWPKNHIAALIRGASRDLGPNVRVGLIGGPLDIPLAAKVVDRVAEDARPGLINWAGKLSIKELGAILERADVLVTGDTGPMHIAAAVGTPIVALFGPADPDRTGPVNHIGLRTPRGQSLVVVNRDGLDCVPCRKRYCRRGDTACMTQLPALRVLEAVRQQLQRP